MHTVRSDNPIIDLYQASRVLYAMSLSVSPYSMTTIYCRRENRQSKTPLLSNRCEREGGVGGAQQHLSKSPT